MADCFRRLWDVQQPADEIVAVAAPEVEKKTLIPNSLFIGIGLAVVSIVSMWLYSLPSIQSDYAFAIIVPILLAGAGWFFIWEGANRKYTGSYFCNHLASPCITIHIQ